MTSGKNSRRVYLKLHITVEQLDELSEKGKKKLLKYVRNTEDYEERYGKVSSWSQLFGKKGGGKALPLLSIGHMIEILTEDIFLKKREKERHAYGGIVIEMKEATPPDFFFWWVYDRNYYPYYPESERGKNPHYYGYSLEPCDALWKAVKEVLEK